MIDAAPPETSRESTGEASGTSPVEVPIFPVGIVQRLNGPDFCMDGARFRLLSGRRIYRLKPVNDQAERYLESVAGSRQRVIVAGYLRYGPECSRIDVYYAGPAESAIEALAGAGKS